MPLQPTDTLYVERSGTAHKVAYSEFGGAVDTSKFATQEAFILSQSLPGFPVTEGLTLAFVPSLSAATLDNADLNAQKVTAITDAGTGLTLGSGGIQPPDLKYSTSNGFWYMETNGVDQGLRLDDFAISNIVSADGRAGSIVCLSTIKTQAQFNFGWYKKNSTNSYNANRRYGVHFPWQDNKYYFDFGNTNGGRVSSAVLPAYANDTTIRTICLTKSPTAQRISIDNTVIASGNPAQSFSDGNGGTVNEVGHLGFGFNVNTTGVPSYWSKMRCYAFLFYNRSLTDEEIGKINEWKNRKIGNTF